MMSDLKDNINHTPSGKGRTGAANGEAQQVFKALDNLRDLTSNLLETIAIRGNLKSAFKTVKRNKGAPGIDKMTIKEVDNNLDAIIEKLQAQLIDGTYRPTPIKGVQIPKPSGGIRQLGIPTVIDRIVQQAISQILTMIFDPMFCDSSYGFRPRRNAKQAIEAAMLMIATSMLNHSKPHNAPCDQLLTLLRNTLNLRSIRPKAR